MQHACEEASERPHPCGRTAGFQPATGGRERSTGALASNGCYDNGIEFLPGRIDFRVRIS
jgi:hypothetical protein